MAMIVPFAVIVAVLVWEWSCDVGWGGWAAAYSACDFWPEAEPD
ncbi:MAG TPA: hypothetical protein VJT12_09165 [Methyloceanibacter sp.]|nr:hypothetical protein [Methyloceanibacter sp.]